MSVSWLVVIISAKLRGFLSVKRWIEQILNESLFKLIRADTENNQNRFDSQLG